MKFRQEGEGESVARGGGGGVGGGRKEQEISKKEILCL